MDRAELPEHERVYCEIKVRGALDPDWSGWFDALTITYDENGDTLLSGTVPDQGALYGVISRIRDLGLQLIFVRLQEPDHE